MLATNLAPKKQWGPWLSDSNQPYPPEMPFFFDPADYPELRRIEENWTVIRDELLDALERENTGLVPYKDLAKTDKAAAWSTAGLVYWTRRSRKNIARFPKTWELFKDIPSLTSCSILMLNPRSTIKPHYGDTDAMVRCHIGLIVPAGLPRCGFRCGTEQKPWVEGKAFCFNDAREHTAWNNTDQHRFIISFDLMRPEYFPMRHWISAQVLGKIDVEVMYQHKPWMERNMSREWQKKLLIGLCKTYWYLRIKAASMLGLTQ